MNHVRCSNCGFLNFASASVCKRCKADFEIASAALGVATADGFPATAQVNFQPMAQWSQPQYEQSYPPPPLYFPTPIAPLPRPSRNGATNVVLWMLLGITVVIALGIGILWKFGKPVSANYSWQEYKSQDDSFSILMPARPVESVESSQIPTGQIQMHEVMADLGSQGAYMVGYSDYPDNSRNVSSDTLLDAAANGAVTHSGATLVSKKRITLDGYPGVELELLPPEGQRLDGGRGFCRIYWVAPRIYIIFAGGPDSGGGSQAVTKFLDSFKLRKRQF
ncbi:MAG: hypothetical protein QOJ02_525 [Acidobacteriota bacterium]|nr:hypothetical protein [Acidobacteriota bacterium]